MTGSLGRGGRRRRVLNEEVIASSSSHQVMRRASDDARAVRKGPRYGEAAAPENQPSLLEFVPGRFATMALAIFLGVALVAALESLHYFGGAISARLGSEAATAIDLAAPASLASWFAAALLMAAGLTCLLIYSLRRHRIDDFRGRYRIWCWAAFACLALSINSIAKLHLLFSSAMGVLVGWTALRDGAVWWMALAAVIFSWIILHVLLDCRESRLAVASFVASALLFATGLVAHLGFVASLQGPVEPMVVAGSKMLGSLALVFALVAYIRYVVLDAEGQILHAEPQAKRKPAAAPPTIKLPTSGSGSATPSKSEAAGSTMKQNAGQGGLLSSVRAASLKLAQRSADDDRWVDGSRPIDDDDCEDEHSRSHQKLSKAERKQMRKLKTQNRAA